MYHELIQHVELTSSTIRFFLIIYFFILPPPSLKSIEVFNNIKIFTHWFILTKTQNSFRVTIPIPPVTNLGSKIVKLSVMAL